MQHFSDGEQACHRLPWRFCRVWHWPQRPVSAFQLTSPPAELN